MSEKIKGFFVDAWKKILKNKIKIGKFSGIIAILVLVAFLIEYFGLKGGLFNQYCFLLILCIEFLVAFFVLFRKKIGERPEIGFLAVALIAGSLLSFSEPKTYVSWDERIHFKRGEDIKRAVIGGPTRPNEVESSYSLEEQKKINSETNEKYKKPKSKNFGILHELSYNRLGYLPAALVLTTGELIGLPYHIIFIFGRWINVLVYALVVYFAIKKLKSGKMIMSVVALLPTAVFLSANYNYDSWVTAFSLLGLAYVFSELQQPEKKITVKEMAIMIGAFIVAMGPKAIYFGLMLLLLLLNKQKFANIKQYKKYMFASALSVLFVLGSFVIPFVIGGPGEGDKRGGKTVNAAEQVQFVLSEPIEYSKILGKFMVGYINPMNATTFVSSFAYLGIISGFGLVMLLLAFVTFTDKNEFDKHTANWKTRLLVIGIYLATVALIASALYVSFTPVRSEIIKGVQPRYLLPLLFPVLLILGSSRFKNPFNKNIYNLAIFIVMAAVLLNGTWELIISRYY